MSVDPSPPRQCCRADRAGVVAAAEAVLHHLQRCFLVAGLAVLVAACADTGDFGRPRTSVWNDVLLPRAGHVSAAIRSEPASSFMYTDEEVELRDRAWRFLMPAHERSIFVRMVSDLVRTRVLPPSMRTESQGTYHAALMSTAEVSPAPLFRRLSEDAAADRKLLPPIIASAERVLAADSARLKLLMRVRDLSGDQVHDAATRVAENRCLIAWVRSEAHERAGRYRYALERLAVEAPQRDAGYAEREVLALEADLSLLNRLPVPPLEAGGCAGLETNGSLTAASPVARPGIVLGK